MIAKGLRDDGQPADAVLRALPVIALELTFSYPAGVEVGPLSPFIIDLDEDCTIAIARVEYAPALATVAALLDVPAHDADVPANVALFRHVRDILPSAYSLKTYVIDPTDCTNRRTLDSTGPLSAVLQTGFISAQRTLDHTTHGETDVIGKLLNKLFRTAGTLGASPDDQEIVSQLKLSVGQLETAVQGDFDTQLKGLLPALNTFGFPSLNDTELLPQTNTPFATQHSVKGAQFENVLVILSGGWNYYNWPRLLEYLAVGNVPANHQAGYLRARNLLYVALSRPEKRLAVLATQQLSPQALQGAERIFGQNNVYALPMVA